MTISLSVALLLASVITASAETVVLKNFTLIDGTGKAAVAKTNMVIVNGRILSVGPNSNLKMPDGSRVQDLSGRYVMPGIINLHGHLGNTIGLVQDPKNYTPENLDANLRTYASYGVTTLVSMGSDQELVLKRRAEQRATGRPKTTRIYTALRGFTGKGGYPTTAQGMKGVPFEVDTPADAKKDVDFLASKKVDLVKIWVDDHFGKEQKIRLDLSKTRPMSSSVNSLGRRA